MNRLVTILLLGGLVFSPVRGEVDPTVDDLFKQAQAAMTAGKCDDALQLDEQIIDSHPEASSRWYEAQIGITQALIKKGDFDGAAKSAHLCLDGAASPGAFDTAVTLTANILSARDKNVDRANKFIAFEQSGGGDGQANPMDEVGYPALPQREAALAAFRQQAGDDQVASRFRAVTYLFTGHPQEALFQYADAFRRADDNPNELNQVIADLINVGLRDVRGHRVGLDEAFQFVLWGPNGPDGKPETPDDLSNPFAKWIPNAPEPGEGGLVGFDAAALGTLRQVRDGAQLYGGDAFLPPDVRHGALSALNRVNGALDGWGSPGQLDWYLSRVFPASGPHPDALTCQLLLQGAELAARGRNLNLGGVHDLWREIDARHPVDASPAAKPINEVRTQFDKLNAQISQTKLPKIDFKTLNAPATF